MAETGDFANDDNRLDRHLEAIWRAKRFYNDTLPHNQWIRQLASVWATATEGLCTELNMALAPHKIQVSFDLVDSERFSARRPWSSSEGWSWVRCLRKQEASRWVLRLAVVVCHLFEGSARAAAFRTTSWTEHPSSSNRSFLPRGDLARLRISTLRFHPSRS